MKIDGKKVAEEIIAWLKSKETPQKILAAVLVGEDPTSISFVKQKEKAAGELGVDFRIYNLSPELGNDGLRREVVRIAKQKPVGGVLVQLPLPGVINKHYILNAVPPAKDVDVLGERALGAFYNNRNEVLPPAVETTREILEVQKVELEKSVVAVIGLGALVGRPISVWLTGKTKELHLLDEKSGLGILKEADIVISGVGKGGLIKAEMLKSGAGVIDFGYYYTPDGKVLGDFDPAGADGVSFYTPTPGGTGPILVAKLIENFYTLCKKQR